MRAMRSANKTMSVAGMMPAATCSARDHQVKSPAMGMKLRKVKGSARVPVPGLP